MCRCSVCVQVCPLGAGVTSYPTSRIGASFLNNSASTLSDEVPTFAIAPHNSVSLHPKSLHQIRTS
jgi:Fe-S-cluster-containing hydrogenase component 2